MVACTRCGFQQDDTHVYCERCGMFLPSLAVYTPGQSEYRVPPQIVVPHPKQRFSLEDELTTRVVIDRCIRIGIAIVGLLIAGFGLFGFFQHIMNIGLIFFLWFVLLIGGITALSVLFFVQKRVPRLRWLHILLGAIGATVVGVILILIVSGAAQNNPLSLDLGFGSTIFFYGLAYVTLVVW